MRLDSPPLHCSCKGEHFKTIFTYTAPPKGETPFQFSTSKPYRRQVLQCQLCGHFVSVHKMGGQELYEGDYVTSNYPGLEGIHRAFERIIGLDPAKSDNAGRVRRVLAFAEQRLPGASYVPSVLDVGSGLCVFLYRMKEAGWDCTALDPDPRNVSHAQEVVGVRATRGDFMTVGGLGCFDVVTFNKVLEHVPDPVAMLAKASKHAKAGGFVYVELPDGEAAAADGPGREEFFIDHWHVFSAASLALLTARAGYSLQALERLHEPSGKYTLRGFLIPAKASVESTIP